MLRKIHIGREVRVIAHRLTTYTHIGRLMGKYNDRIVSVLLNGEIDYRDYAMRDLEYTILTPEEQDEERRHQHADKYL